MRQITAASLLLCAAAGTAQAQETMSFNVVGTSFDGSSYGGTATITILSDTTCEIEWFGEGVSSSGICMADAETLIAAYIIEDLPGLASYDLMADGTLQGVWTIAGVDGFGTETLIPIQ